MSTVRHPRTRRLETLRNIQLGNQVVSTGSISAELEGYVDVLLGRVPPPVPNGTIALMEVASAYLARACEIEMVILKNERDDLIKRGSAFYRLRTGEIRAFKEMAKASMELGSRRITMEQMAIQMKDA